MYTVNTSDFTLTMGDKAVMKQRGKGRPFQVGQSGNPAGRPRGVMNKSTEAVLALMDGEAEAITRKVIEIAKSGDMTAIRIILDRIAPPRKSNPIQFSLAPIDSHASLNEAHNAILKALACGELLPEEAQTLSGMVLSHGKILDTIEFERRLSALEGRLQ